MTIYELSLDIDGFGGKQPERYFFDFKEALEVLKHRSDGFYFYDDLDNEDGLWTCDGIKTVTANIQMDLESVYLHGIPYPDKEKDERSISWAEARITPIDVPLLSDLSLFPFKKVFVLYKKFGYNEYLKRSLDPNYTPPTVISDRIENKTVNLFYSFSKNHMLKMTRTKFRSLPRSWNKKEYDEKIDPASSKGEDFLCYAEFEIEGEPKVVLEPEILERIFLDCLTNDKEHGLDSGVVVMHNFLFDKEKLELHRNKIDQLLSYLPKEFFKRTGGGWSFLMACNDKNGRQWTGMHLTMEKLFALGIGIGKVKHLVAQQMWFALPGGVPYFVINDDEEKEEKQHV